VRLGELSNSALQNALAGAGILFDDLSAAELAALMQRVLSDAALRGDVLDAQPIVVDYPFGLAMVHNGNVVNFAHLRRHLYEEHHRLVDTSNDVALILYTFASKLETKDLKHLSIDDVFDCVAATQEEVQGAYSAVTIIANHGLLAFCDPHGIRPLVMGRQVTGTGVSYAFASETTCFDHLDAPPVRVHGLDIPMPYAANLEKLALPRLDQVVEAAKRVTYK